MRIKPAKVFTKIEKHDKEKNENVIGNDYGVACALLFPLLKDIPNKFNTDREQDSCDVSGKATLKVFLIFGTHHNYTRFSPTSVYYVCTHEF